MRFLNIRTAVIFNLIFVAAVFSQGNLLIIAPDEFVDELKPLKRFKDCSLRPATLLSLSQVYLNFSGVDKAEQIKKCIAHYEKTKSIESVMLVGDVDKFPVRWRWWGRWMPQDPYFKGKWSVVNGAYQQSIKDTSIQYYSWIDVGSYTEYILEVDCKPIHSDSVQWETRILYADADLSDCRYRVDLLDQQLRLIRCTGSDTKNYNFTFNQIYHIKIKVSSDSVKAWVNGVLQFNTPIGSCCFDGGGKVGVGTKMCKASFDNVKVTHNATVLLDENFNDGIANGFTDAATMDERNWMVSDLYYADLYKSNGTFDDWDSNDNGLYGEIEFKIDTYNPNAVINNDNINYFPDIAVGRIPASTEDEVESYVNKVLTYEMLTTRTASWFKTAVLYEGETGGSNRNDNIETYLTQKGFSVSNRYWTNDLKNMTNDQRKNLIVNDINQGAGFINYLGHGNRGSWGCVNFSHTEVKEDLTNTTQLPIVVAGACHTSMFALHPPWNNYIDINDVAHKGTVDACECFPGPPEYSSYASPKTIQVDYDVGCIGEDFLFNAGDPNGSAGAIAYLGERSAGRPWGSELTEYFLKAYSEGSTIGDMWKKMIEDYYWARQIDKCITWNYTPAKWDTAHLFDEPQKFVLFGDPSVCVGGAFNQFLSGHVSNTILGHPLYGYIRYRVTGNITVPVGQTLTADLSLSILFENGKKITAMDTHSSKGFIMSPQSGMTIYLLSIPPDPKSSVAVCGAEISGQFKMRNGGTIKFY
jgi:hypothetical protein